MKRLISLIVNAMALPAIAFMALAIPATTRPVVLTMPDGTTREVRLFGDEHSHVITSPDATRLLRRTPDNFLVDAGSFDQASWRRLQAAPSAPKKLGIDTRSLGTTTYPAHGTQRAVAILVQFPKTDAHPDGLSFGGSDPRQLFEDMLNRDGFDHDGATGSVHEYFKESSNGLFDLTFDVYGPVTLEKDLAFYGTKINGEDLNAWNMVVEGCRAIDDQVDFRNYDRDNDGIIDNVYIFYAGQGAATGGDPAYTVWQHAADVEKITGQSFTFDGVRLNHYACSNEYREVKDGAGTTRRIMEGIGTVTHEFSHVLGLPDLYDTRGGGNVTPGFWSNMDTGCHLNDSRTPPLASSFERLSLGWLDPVAIGGKPETLSLRDISSNEAYVINTDRPEEYFLLENRQQKGWDAFLPGHGMLVWHINYMADYWQYNQVNTQRGYLGVDIVRADGNYGDGTLGADVFPGPEGVTALTDDGYPNMRTLAGGRTNAPLSGITEAGGIITFDICKLVSHLDKVEGLSAGDVTPEGFTASWTPLAGVAAGYQLNLFSVLGNELTIVEPYRNFTVAAPPFTFEGLTPETDYRFTVTAVSGSVLGETSEPCDVSTPAMTFGYTRPGAAAASDVTATSFTANWMPLDDAADYIVNVYTKSVGEPDTQTVDFTGGLDQLMAGWSTNCSFTMSIAGYYGESSPALSMADDYGRIQSPALGGRLRGVKFWYRERTGSGKSHIAVSVLADGRWIEIDRVELPEKMSEGAIFTLGEESGKIPENAIAARIVYHRVEKGTLAVDDVTVSYNDNFHVTPLVDWADCHVGSTATSVSVDGLEKDGVYYYTVRGVDAEGTQSLNSAETKVVTTDGASLTDMEWSDGEGFDRNVTVEIYDLAGRRVAPGRAGLKGVYILKQGNKIEKKIF